LFGTYKQAGAIADQMLLVWAILIIVSRCQNSSVGKAAKFFINSRLCFRSLIQCCGSMKAVPTAPLVVEGATVIKFHTKTPKISYLFTLTLILIPSPLHTHAD